MWPLVGRVTVTIQVSNYGGIGRVTETLPAGFAYVSSTHDSAGVSVNGQGGPVHAAQGRFLRRVHGHRL